MGFKVDFVTIGVYCESNGNPYKGGPATCNTWISQFQLPCVHESHLVSTTAYFSRRSCGFYGPRIEVASKKGDVKEDLSIGIFSKDSGIY